MTRTARAAYPRAVIKDRSESRSGLDTSMRKAGAGHHNWGSLADERQLEFAASNDKDFEEEEPAVPLSASEDTSSTRSVSPAAKPEMSRSFTSEMSEEELEKARQFRKNLLKKSGELDLTAIARTSAAVVSPTNRRSGLDNLHLSPADYMPAAPV